MQPKWQSATSACKSCHLAAVCAEGYLGCGIRITPDLKLSPCILRPELALSLKPLLRRPEGDLLADVDAVLTGVRQGSVLETGGI